VQVGITLVGIFAGAYGGARMAQPLTELLDDVPWLSRYADEISLFVVVSIITFLSVVIGELVPKRIALGSAETIAAGVARPMNTLSVLARPSSASSACRQRACSSCSACRRRAKRQSARRRFACSSSRARAPASSRTPSATWSKASSASTTGP
jgi:CBS domain containing-hemolysin-like protein